MKITFPITYDAGSGDLLDADTEFICSLEHLSDPLDDGKMTTDEADEIGHFIATAMNEKQERDG